MHLSDRGTRSLALSLAHAFQGAVKRDLKNDVFKTCAYRDLANKDG